MHRCDMKFTNARLVLNPRVQTQTKELNHTEDAKPKLQRTLPAGRVLFDSFIVRRLLILATVLLAGCATVRKPGIAIHSPLIVRGTSMEPTIKDGAKLFLVSVDFESLYVGEIVIYANSFYPEDSLTHRLVRKTPKGWITKGDNNLTEDRGFVTRDNLIGAIAFVR